MVERTEMDIEVGTGETAPTIEELRRDQTIGANGVIGLTPPSCQLYERAVVRIRRFRVRMIEEDELWPEEIVARMRPKKAVRVKKG